MDRTRHVTILFGPPPDREKVAWIEVRDLAWPVYVPAMLGSDGQVWVDVYVAGPIEGTHVWCDRVMALRGVGN